MHLELINACSSINRLYCSHSNSIRWYTKGSTKSIILHIVLKCCMPQGPQNIILQCLKLSSLKLLIDLGYVQEHPFKFNRKTSLTHKRQQVFLTHWSLKMVAAKFFSRSWKDHSHYTTFFLFLKVESIRRHSHYQCQKCNAVELSVFNRWLYTSDICKSIFVKHNSQ